MADLSKIKIPNGTEYNLKDAQARADIESLNGSLNNEYSYGLVDEKEGMSISITTEQKKSLINVNANGVTTQDGIPTPESPIEYAGYGELQENGTYSVSISVTDANGDAHTIIASGLSAPIYEGDYVDFVNGKVVRRMKELQLTSFSSFTILYGRGKMYGGVATVITSNGHAKCNIATRAINVDNAFSVYSSMCRMVILYGTSEDTTEESMRSKFENAKFLLPLYTPIEESITLSEDVSTYFGELTLSGDSTITVKYRADIKTYIAEQIQAIAISMTEGYMSLGEE